MSTPNEELVAAASDAGLIYVTDASAGIRRARYGTGFRYTYPDGFPVKDKKTLERIQSVLKGGKPLRN